MLETVVVDAANNAVDVECLSVEFGKIAERVQSEVSGDFDLLNDSDWAEVDRAERVVDECAADLRMGRGDRTIWLVALDSYERTWSAVLARKTRHQSLAA